MANDYTDYLPPFIGYPNPGRRAPNAPRLFDPVRQAVNRGQAQGRALMGGGKYGGQSLVRAIDNQQLSSDDEQQAPSDTQIAVRASVEGDQGGGASMTPRQPSLAGGVNVSDADWNDMVMRTSQTNGNVVSMAPEVPPELHAARLAALDRGESIDLSGQGQSGSGEGSAMLGALQTKLADLDNAITAARDGSVVGDWRSRQLMRQREQYGQTGAALINSQTAMRNADTTAANVGNEFKLGVQRDRTMRRGQGLSFEQGMAGVDAQRRGQDLSYKHGMASIDTQQRGQDMTHNLGLQQVAAQRYSADAGLAPHLPKMGWERDVLDLYRSGNAKEAERLAQLYNRPAADGAVKPIVGPAGQTIGALMPDGTRRWFSEEEMDPRKRKATGDARELYPPGR